MYRLALCLVLVASTLATPRPAAAAIPLDVYDTVDFVEFNKRDSGIPGNPPSLLLRGIPTGASAPLTRRYSFFNTSGQSDGLEAALHCHRLAVLAMSKPGKFQFAIGSNNSVVDAGCRLTLVAP